MSFSSRCHGDDTKDCVTLWRYAAGKKHFLSKSNFLLMCHSMQFLHLMVFFQMNTTHQSWCFYFILLNGMPSQNYNFIQRTHLTSSSNHCECWQSNPNDLLRWHVPLSRPRSCLARHQHNSSNKHKWRTTEQMYHRVALVSKASTCSHTNFMPWETMLKLSNYSGQLIHTPHKLWVESIVDHLNDGYLTLTFRESFPTVWSRNFTDIWVNEMSLCSLQCKSNTSLTFGSSKVSITFHLLCSRCQTWIQFLNYITYFPVVPTAT